MSIHVAVRRLIVGVELDAGGEGHAVALTLCCGHEIPLHLRYELVTGTYANPTRIERGWYPNPEMGQAWGCTLCP